jgi:hypothetical protein
LVPSDLIFSLDSISWLVFTIVVGLSTLRAFAVRKALFSGLYKRRALWTGALGMLVLFHAILLFSFVSGIITFPVPPAQTGIPNTVHTFVLRFADFATFLTW